MKRCNKVFGLCLSLLLGMPSVASAYFDIHDEGYHAEGYEGYYGDGETRRFKDYVEGTDALSPADRAFLDSVVVNRITQRWYIRAIAGNGKTKMDGVSNNSSYPYNEVLLSDGTITKNLIQLLVAGGYLWEHWAIEGELFFTKKLNYDQIAIGSTNTDLPTTIRGTAIAIQSEINQIGLLVNLVYVIPRYFDFYPQHLQLHLDAGVGPMLKQTDSKTYNLDGSPRQSGSANTLAWMGKLAAGGRYQVTTHFLVDIMYLYLFLGKTDFGPVESIKFNSSKTQSNAFFFGLTYQI